MRIDRGLNVDEARATRHGASRGHRFFTGLVAAGVLSTAGPCLLNAQAPERVVSEAAEPCPGCALIIGPHAVIGDRDDNYLDDVVFGMAVNSLGHVFALSLNNMSRITEFDDGGQRLRQLGGAGDGPGEFRRVLGLLVGPGDSLFAFHSTGTSVFNRDGEFVRQYSGHRALQRPIRLESGHIVNIANPGVPVGQPIVHVYGEGGDARRSFGPVTTPARLEGAALMPPHVHAPSSGDTFWLAPRAPYRLERWNAGGEVDLVLERSARHHTATEYPLAYQDGRLVTTYPFLSAVAEDSSGRVWTAVVDQVSPRAGDPPGGGNRFESTLEVLDPTTGGLLGVARVPGIVSMITPHGYIVSRSEGEHGVQLLTVLHARVQQPEGP